jgi:hypothetical protein
MTKGASQEAEREKIAKERKRRGGVDIYKDELCAMIGTKEAWRPKTNKTS